MASVLKCMLDAVDDGYQKTIGFPTHDLLKGAAMVVTDLLDVLDVYASKLDVSRLVGVELDRFVFQRKGLRRIPATYATAVLTLTGNATVRKGALFQTPERVVFAATEEVVIADTGTVAVQAVVQGTYSNVPAGAITVMTATIPGVVSVTNAAPAVAAYDAETDRHLYERYIFELQKPATSGNVYHYEKWAREVAGVGGVKVFPLWQGANTVQVVIIDVAQQPASAELVKAVQDHIDPGIEGLGRGVAPIGAYCTVTAATPVVINVSVRIVGTGYDKDLIRANLVAYLARIAFTVDERIAGYVSIGKIGNEINDAPGVVDYSDLTINGGTINVQVPEKSIAILGDVTYLV